MVSTRSSPRTTPKRSPSRKLVRVIRAGPSALDATLNHACPACGHAIEYHGEACEAPHDGSYPPITITVVGGKRYQVAWKYHVLQFVPSGSRLLRALLTKTPGIRLKRHAAFAARIADAGNVATKIAAEAALGHLRRQVMCNCPLQWPENWKEAGVWIDSKYLTEEVTD